MSPGVDVEIIDESAYTSSGPGTVPLIVIATAANKPAPSGTGIAPLSAPAQAETLYAATSQRDLVQQFGTPTFKNVQGTPVHGDETNEYGLFAAYSYLGQANQAYILRADVDLSQLEPSASAPSSPPAIGTYWLDTSQTLWGVFQSNGNNTPGLAWTNQVVLVANTGNVVTGQNSLDVPAPSFGAVGNFAIVVTMSSNLLYENISIAGTPTWLQVGSTAWAAARPTTVLGSANPQPIQLTDTIVINGTTVSFTNTTGSIADVISTINAAAITNVTASLSNGTTLMIQNTAGGNLTIANGNGTPLTTLGIVPGSYSGPRVFWTNDASYPAGSSSGDVWIKGTIPNKGANWIVNYFGTTSTWTAMSTPHYQFNSQAQDGDTTKDQAAIQAMGAPGVGTLYVGYDPNTGIQQLRRWNGNQWQNLSYEAANVAPTTAPAAGTFWYNTNFQVDIMYGTGQEWLGYRDQFPETDPNGVIISGSQPVQQSGGAALVDNDLWVDSSNLEDYPLIYRFASASQSWTLIDNTDQTSPFGIVFADARQDSGTNYTGNQNAGNYNYNSTATADLVLSSFVDPDAPDPSTFPDGMLLFNTRFSTYNVKEWNPTYFNAGGFDPNTNFTQTSYHVGNGQALFPPLASPARWVTASGNQANGSPYMGRKAQRTMVVRALASVVESDQDIRSELVYFNLVACPGYPELMDQMIGLNADNKQVAFNIGDTPIRLQPDATDVQNWATNAADVPATGEDGLVASDPYTGVYYPWGLSTDLSGNEIMIPPSCIALNTIAFNDQIAYMWYAPAGYTRGLVTNASSVGYLTSEGEYQPTILNQGQRDTLYTNKINPIAYIPGKGLVVYGQKTLNPNATALDRINVARLCNYLAYNLDNLVKPFLFEQNDSQTQTAAANLVSKFLNGLVGLQAINDYAVLCDGSNNTPDRVAANELWIDVAVVPIQSVEFIYVPVRILTDGGDVATAVTEDNETTSSDTSIASSDDATSS